MLTLGILLTSLGLLTIFSNFIYAAYNMLDWFKGFMSTEHKRMDPISAMTKHVGAIIGMGAGGMVLFLGCLISLLAVLQ